MEQNEIKYYDKGMLLNLPIEDLDFSAETYNGLKREGIHTVSELVKFTGKDLLNVRNLGSRSIEKIEDKLESLGLKLGMQLPEKATTGTLENIKQRNEELKSEIDLKRAIIKELTEREEILSTIAELDSQIAELQNPVNSKENSEGHTR